MMLVRRPAGSRSGHSLVELVVVVCMMSLGATLAARGTAPFYGMVGSLQDRVEGSQELLMAREYLRYDLSGAQTALPAGAGRLKIVREPLVAEKFGVALGVADDGVEYHLKDGRLYREDLVFGETLVVADHLEDFSVTRVGGSETRIQISDGSDKNAHYVTLVWPK